MHKLDRNMPCWCGSGKKYKHCHFDFDEKLDDMHRRGAVVPTHDMIKTEAQIAGIRESAKINVAVRIMWRRTSARAFPRRRSTAGYTSRRPRWAVFPHR